MIVIAFAIVLSVVGMVLGLALSLVGVFGSAVTLLVRRDWVPVVYNIRSLLIRKTSTLFTALGLALVVAIVTVAMMLVSGIRATLVSTGSADNVKVYRKGAQSEVQSGMLPDQVRLVSSAPEIAIGQGGQPLSSAELVVLIFAQKRGATTEQEGTNLTVRGVGTHATDVHQNVKIVGRMFKPGTSEVLIGKGLIGKFQGMELGGKVPFARREWEVVGILDGGGSGFDSEVWGDVEQFEDAFQRRPQISSVTMRMKDRSMFAALETRMASDPQLAQLEMKPEIKYWSDQSEGFAKFMTALGAFVAIIFAFGAVLGAMITMYAQVAARTREIGTLRALGFRRRAVLVSFIVESVLMALISGVLGVFIASFAQLGSFSTMNFVSFSEVNFKFVLTPGIIVAAFMFAGLLGYAGGLLPALRASRKPIVEATRGG